MVRENWHIYPIPEEWIKRRTAGLCPVCGKEKSQFAKGRKVYCSTKCADLMAEKFQTWGSLRDSIIDASPICVKCGITQEKFNEKEEKRIDKEWQALMKKYAKEIEEEKLEQLLIKEKYYLGEIEEVEKADYKEYWVQRVIEKLEGKENMPKYAERWKGFEVDHIIPVSQEGDQWDKKNLQVICYDCHKKKTKQDLKNAKKEA